MAFAPGFEYDIIISYSHLDNHAPEGKDGWVTHFHAELESWLARRFGYNKIKIWRDTELHGNTLFNSRIGEIIRQSALFVALTSGNYLKSAYCRKELEWFYNTACGHCRGLDVKGESRLFNVLLGNIPYDTWPMEFKGISGFPMHDAEEKSGAPGEPLDHRELQFQKRLRHIVDAVDNALHAFIPIPGPEEPVESGPVIGEPESFNVFIADTADSLQTTRDFLIADLEDRGVRILDFIPPPMNHDAHEAAVEKSLADADLAIHLFDELPGRKITDFKSSTYPRKQLDIGFRSSASQLIWVPKDLSFDTIEDADYAGFLKALESGGREDKEYEFIRESKTGLYRLVMEKIEALNSQKETGGQNATVLLDTHQKDQRFAFKLADYLSEKGLTIEINQESRDPIASLRNFEEALGHARNLVILFGHVAPGWVRERLKKVIQHISTQLIETSQVTLENRWLYLLPPCTITGEIDRLVKGFGIQYLDNRNVSGIDKQAVAPLLSARQGIVSC